MSIFEEVVLSWDGVEYKIDPERVMGAIAKVEEIITLRELSEYAQKGDAPMAKLAMAFASVLRYAGAKCIQECFLDRVKNQPLVAFQCCCR